MSKNHNVEVRKEICNSQLYWVFWKKKKMVSWSTHLPSQFSVYHKSQALSSFSNNTYLCVQVYCTLFAHSPPPHPPNKAGNCYKNCQTQIYPSHKKGASSCPGAWYFLSEIHSAGRRIICSKRRILMGPFYRWIWQENIPSSLLPVDRFRSFVELFILQAS